MKRHEAIEIISQYLTENDLIVSSTGNISRELSIIADSRQIFYMMGSLGLTSSIGLGLAICNPNKRIIAIEGDGSIIMNMGSMATIGHYRPRNLVHVILDNEAYDSTGGQSSVSNTANLDEIARSAGYEIVRKAISEHELRKILDDHIEFHSIGPIFVLVKVEKGGIRERIPRIPYEPYDITTHFRSFIKESCLP